MRTGKIVYRAGDFHEDPGPSSVRPAATVQTVDELSSKIRDAITASPTLRNIAVRGELQNFKMHGSGHVYFTLVGVDSRIAGVMFRSSAANVLTWPRDGDEVMVTGSVDVYAKSGVYQLYATRMLPLGIGAQARAKEELRLTLEKEGLFDIRHKRPLPRYPAKVAVITSPTGAAIQDILKVSLDRSPFVDIVLIPAVVQGVDAPVQVASALALVGAQKSVECVILARGGGAKDDLSPFDDERIVRAVRSCPVPVVTGVGHQTDSFLADLAADAALPTPSAAAERVFPQRAEIIRLLDAELDAMASGVLRNCERAHDQTVLIEEGLVRRVLGKIDADSAFLSDARKSLSKSVTRFIERNEDFIAASASKLDALSPLSILGRGYSICAGENGEIIGSVAMLKPGDTINVRFKDGKAIAEVLETSAIR